VPVVSLEYHPTAHPASECLKLRVVMYRLGDSGEPCGFGFRLESPTSHCTGSRVGSIHDFYHVQMITELTDGPPLDMPEWLPCRQPAISIRANNPVEAMFNLILSLYGLDFYNDFLKSIKGRLNINIDLLSTPK